MSINTDIRGLRRHWDTSSLRLEAANTNYWGIPEEYRSAVKELVVTAVMSQPGKEQESPVWQWTAEEKIPFPLLKLLVAFLYERGYYEDSLLGAIAKAGNDLLDIPIPGGQPNPEAAEDMGKSAPVNGPRPFRDKWVFVVGISQQKLPDKIFRAGRTVGKLLAREGYGLITGGWAGVDQVCAAAYAEELKQYDLSEKTFVQQMASRGSLTNSPYGTKIPVEGAKRWLDYPLERAFAVILIGGESGTHAAFVASQQKRIPVIPISSTDGEALRAFTELSSREDYFYPLELVQPEALPLDPSGGEDVTAARLREILEIVEQQTADGEMADLSEDDFKDQVMQLYREKPVVVPDDLQKNRWGGRSSSNGHTLKASVIKLGASSFKVTLIVDSSKKARRFNGKVAFLLHNSFEPEIQYETAVKGKAQMEVMAHEAFTAGAYLQDGTTLELDLNDSSGHPKDFYYKTSTDTFKKNVQILLDERRITLPDDPQKDRWGSKSIRNGKQLQCEIKEARINGGYNIILEVSAANPSQPLTGDVAFFLHTDFDNPVVYRQAANNIARINFNFSEPFTVGAYTQDGTMLELDLRRSFSS